MNSTLGVVIPTVGQRPELKAMLESVLIQTRAVQQIRIVVDSDDTSLVDSIVGDLFDRLSNVDLEVISTGARREEGAYLVDTGYGYAINLGLERLSTDLVAFLDDDDEIRPTHFHGLEAALSVDTGVGASYARVKVVSPDGASHLFPDGPMPDGTIDVGTLIDAHPVLLPAVLVYRSVLESVGPMDETLDREADTDMIVRLGLATAFAPVDDPTYIYNRVSRKSVAGERMLEERARLLEKHQAHVNRNDRLRLWDVIARTALRSGYPDLGRRAAAQVIDAGRLPKFLESWYLTIRSRPTPEFMKKLAAGRRR